MDYITVKQAEVYNDFNEIIQSKLWHRTFLKNCETQIQFPDFEDPMKASRVRT